MTDEPVEPALTEKNGAGRFLLIPAGDSTWPAPDGVGGWICKVLKMNRSTHITTLKFKDGNVDVSTKDALLYKPVSGDVASE